MTARFAPLALAGLSALAISGAALAQAPAASPSEPPGDAVRGKTLFVANGCYTCHGTRGNGGGVAGPQIVPPLPVAAFTRQLRQPLQKMPAFSEAVVSAADIADMMAYLRTTPKGRPASDIPLLRDAP